METEPELVCKRTLKGLDELSDESIMEFELDEFTEYPNVYMIGMQYLTWPVDETKLPGSIKDKDWGILSSSVRTMYEEGDKRRDAYFYEFEKWANPDSVHVTGGYAYVNKWREGVYVRYSWSPGSAMGLLEIELLLLAYGGYLFASGRMLCQIR